MAVSLADINLLSKQDTNRVAELSAMYMQTSNEAERNKIHGIADAIRAKYGYSGGVDGTSFVQKTANAVASVVTSVANTVSAVTPTVSAIMPTAQQITAATNVLVPTVGDVVSSPIVNDGGFITGITTPSMGVSENFALPDETKKYIMYGGIFVLILLAFKTLGGK